MAPYETVEVSECCQREAVEGFDENPRDHHDSIPVWKCTKCQRTCELTEICLHCHDTGIIEEKINEDTYIDHKCPFHD